MLLISRAISQQIPRRQVQTEVSPWPLNNMSLTTFASRGVRNQYIAGAAACLSAVTSASCYAWPAPLLPRLLAPASPLPLSAPQLSWVVSVLELGCLLSCVPAALLADLVGRKLLLLSSAPLYLVSWTLLLSFRTPFGLAMARLLQGFTIGIVCTTAPIYVEEISSSRNRGTVTGMFSLLWWFGFLLQYSVGPQLCFEDFTYFTMMLNIPFWLMFLWQPESPTFYLLSGDEERATRSLLRLRDGSIDAIKREIDEIKLNLDVYRKTVTFRELFATSVDRKGLTILMVIVTVRVLSGNSVISVYATHIFQQIPESFFSPDGVTVVLGSVMFLGSVASSYYFDRFGRRPLLLGCCTVSFVCHLCAGAYFYFLNRTDVDVTGFGWLPPLAVTIYSGLYCFGFNPVSVAYTSELFRSTTRGVASTLSSMTITVLVFVMLSIYEPVLHDYGMQANFFFYALACFVGCVYFYFSAIETRGKSFFQVRKELCGANSASRSSEREPLFVDVDVEQL